MVEQREKSRELDRCLRALERSALDPVIPGQVRSWCQQVAPAADEASPLVEARCEELDEAIENIEESDLALIPRAEGMEETMATLCHDWDDLGERLDDQVEREVDLGDSDEPIDEVKELQDDILQWILRWRKLDAAVTGWRMESETRERGVVD